MEVNEISIDIPVSDQLNKMLLHCISCGGEFDPQSKEQAEIPSVNYCHECFIKQYQSDNSGNA